MNSDEIYMQLAIDKAWEYQGLTYPNPAVGAVVVCNGEILAIEAHQKAGSSHAEVLALIKAYESKSNNIINFDRQNAQLSHNFLLSLPLEFWRGCCIYVTLEPCSHSGKTPSCASLLESLGLDRVIIGISDPISGHGGGADRLANAIIGVLPDKCNALIEPFMIWQDRAFVVFKLAQSSNGRIGTSLNGGYLSSSQSLYHVHQMRGVCDVLCIGANTVREDRPTLDCRFTKDRPPKVMIYTREDNIDRDIPLFDIEDRIVEIGDDLEFLSKPSFVIVEGGSGMLNAMESHIDCMLVYQTPRLSTHRLSYDVDMELEFLHQSYRGVDLITWSRII